MFVFLLKLEFKEFLRSKRFSKRLISSILLGLFFLYLALNAIVLGFGMYYGIKESKPDIDVFRFVNNYLIYFFGLFFMLLVVMSNIPSMKVKPLMILPIKKKTIVNYFIFKLIFNFFFFVPFIVFVSFSAALVSDGYNWVNVSVWFLSLMSIIVMIQYLNFLIEKNTKVVFFVALIALGVYVLKKFELLDIPAFFGNLFYSIYENPSYFAALLLLFAFMHLYLFRILKSQFYVDGAIRPERKKSTELKLSWLDRFGTMASFLKNDIRMIWRNKRPRRTFFWSFYFLFYGAYLI
ncbi:MAG TPA: hypothetical protein ENK91_13470, partial [Bacteroidetes bacterium]|nr:hypothetical protein [Bacteroidota bacterium]